MAGRTIATSAKPSLAPEVFAVFAVGEAGPVEVAGVVLVPGPDVVWDAVPEEV